MEKIKPQTTPKDFFLWLGAMVALYVSAVSFVMLLHTYIDAWFPDTAIVYGDPYSGPMRFAIASLIVMFPLCVWFLRILHRDITMDSSKKDIWVRRWLVMLTIFVSGLVMAIDVIVLINTYLGGELSVRFGLKAFSVLVIFSIVFWYFLEELKGTWERKTRLSSAIGIASLLMILVAIGASFFIIGSPESARLQKFDQQKVVDLQNIQWQIVSYWQSKELLPSSLDDLADPLRGFTVPVDAQSGEHYSYEKTGDLTFKLCARFNTDTSDIGTSDSELSTPVRPIDPSGENWTHTTGFTCFDRTIDPEFFPPYKTAP